MDKIKKIFKNIFKFHKELTKEEEQEVIAKIFKKIKESSI